MKTNVGTVDRIVRIGVGAALIGVALGLFGPAYQTAWGWIGLLPLLTGIAGWCPAYTVCGIETRRSAAAK